jgi:uncharacterized protein (TIGR02270 family)
VLAITEEHAAQAGFLWMRRESAAVSSHFRLADLAFLDERVEAHLDGLRLAGGEGAAVAAALARSDEPGALFVAADRALAARDARAFATVLDAVAEEPARARPVVAALAWAPAARSAWAVKALLHPTCPPALHRLGIAARVAHREDPGDPLVHALWGDDPALRRTGLVALGRLGKRELLGLAQEDYGQSDPEVRLCAATSGLLLGDRRALEALVGLAAGAFRDRALGLLLRVADAAESARQVQRLLVVDRRAAIDAMEASLDVRWVPLLVEALFSPATARLAARTLATLTGIAVAGPLAGSAPEGFRAGPSDDPEDPDVALDPDIALPWPAPEALAARVRAAAPGLQGRVLWGKPMGADIAAVVLRKGTQRERRAAALELALLRPGTPLVEVRAPGFRQ